MLEVNLRPKSHALDSIYLQMLSMKILYKIGAFTSPYLKPVETWNQLLSLPLSACMAHVVLSCKSLMSCSILGGNPKRVKSSQARGLSTQS